MISAEHMQELVDILAKDEYKIRDVIDMAYDKGRKDTETELNALGECEYNKGAEDFAEWLEKHAIVTIQDGITMFCEDEDKSPHGFLELLAEWQKLTREKNDKIK